MQSIHSSAPNVALLLTDTVTASVAAVKAGYAFACNGPSQFDVAFYSPLMLFMWNLGFLSRTLARYPASRWTCPMLLPTTPTRTTMQRSTECRTQPLRERTWAWLRGLQ